MTVIYPAHIAGMEFRTPIVVVKMTIMASMVGTLTRSRRKPMNGVDKTPPIGSAASKKSLIRSAWASDPSMYSYCVRIVAMK